MSKKEATKAATANTKVKKSKEPYTHIDRSLPFEKGLLRKSELDKKNPHVGPVSNQGSVEELTEAEYEKANG